MKQFSIFMLAVLFLCVWYAAAKAGKSPDLIEGEITAFIGESGNIYHIDDGTSNYELLFDAEPPSWLETGVKASVLGQIKGHRLDVDNIVQIPDEPTSLNERSILVVPIQYRGVYEYSDQVFDKTIPNVFWRSSWSVDQVYTYASKGQESYPEHLGRVAEPITVRRLDRCNILEYGKEANTKLERQGINRFEYNHVIYLLPPGSVSQCGFTAIAGSLANRDGMSVVWTTTLTPMVLIHEIGHNRGLHHAGVDADNDGILESRVGDGGDIMSYCCALRLWSAAMLETLGWLEGYPAGTVIDVTSDGEYVLGPLYKETPYPQVLRIQKPSTGQVYFVSYRKPGLLDNGEKNLHLDSRYINGATLQYGHAWPQCCRPTALVNTFEDGELWEDELNGITIEQFSHDSEGVHVQITFGSQP